MSATIFPHYCKSQGIPVPVAEYRFGAEASGGSGKGLRERLDKSGLKDWRFDYAIVEHMVALEVEGGVFSGGRHTRPTGFLGDMAKYNAAAAMGWLVIRCTPKTLCTLETINYIKSAIATRTAA